MSEENIETLRRSNEAFNRGDRVRAFAHYHPDIEWRDLQYAPDTPELIRGPAALLRVWEQWQDAFDELTAEIRRYVDCGDFVLAETHWRATGKGSGLVLDLQTVDAYEFADGKVIRTTIGYSDLESARAAIEAPARPGES